MSEETPRCPKCGCNKFFLASAGLTPEDELYECAYCKAILDIAEISQRKPEKEMTGFRNSATV